MIGGSGGECRRSEEVEVSVIIPCYNAIRWLEECLSSCLLQDFQGTMEVSIFDDSSSDGSDLFIRSWEEKFRARGIGFVANGNRWEENEDRDEEAPPGGVGRAKNKAVAQSSGKFLCFLDADDIMLPHRVRTQLSEAKLHPHAIVGGGIEKIPKGSTEFFARWANTLTAEQLWLQQFRETTLLMPTWFISRETFEAVGGFEESSPTYGEAEDLIFFHKHLGLQLESLALAESSAAAAHRRALEGQREGRRVLTRVGDADEPVLLYRFSSDSQSWKTSRQKLLKVRVKAFEERILNGRLTRALWRTFTIWGAGRDGRQFLAALSPEGRERVTAMCDVDEKKVGKTYFNHRSAGSRHVPIIHYTQVKGPVVVCVSLRRFSEEEEGQLEANVRSLGLEEGLDLWYFM
mmetsp:Transcript_49120/g.154197  ORF Transcript_49120/g.154197 Transcript_49120/m.154197 type:complete len:404 (-) Transcript_49120:47-1258(-)